MAKKSDLQSLLTFSSDTPCIMHIDLNSCFASIEQQANPFLRGKPVAVAAYTTPNGCIVAPSIEAKRVGIKVGMRVKEGKAICPNLIVLPPDPWKYRNVHLKLRDLLSEYTPEVTPKSIDEFVLDFRCFGNTSNPADVVDFGGAKVRTPNFYQTDYSGFNCFRLQKIAKEIKFRIKKEIGEWLTVSIGIAPNRFLAKLASGLHKPDGLEEINKNNFLDCYLKLKLTDLPYIKERNAVRLGSMGIYSVVDFYNAPLWKLKAAFQSINGYYWYLRIHGYEIDDIEFGRKSFGNSYALARPLMLPVELSPILCKLVEKTGFRLRRAGYSARGVHLAVLFRNGFFWHKGISFPQPFFDSREIYKKAFWILSMMPTLGPVREIAVSVFDLRKKDYLQLDLFSDCLKKERLVKAFDKINNRWGSFVLTPGRMLFLKKGEVPDRIAFGGVKELEEFTIKN